MLKLIKTQLRQGHRTSPYPKGTVEFPERFRGRPTIDPSKCASSVCGECAKACPTNAIQVWPGPKIDLGKCLFCLDCLNVCPSNSITSTTNHRMATRKREDLLISSDEIKLAAALDEKSRKLFGRSLKLRSVEAGDCSGCAAELQALNNVVFDLGRFGIQFVASPRHADGVVITGPVTENMHLALKKTFEAIPAPKLVIAVGACAISGGPFVGSSEIHNGADSTLSVDLYIPGCPPHPLTLLDGLLRLLGRLNDSNIK